MKKGELPRILGIVILALILFLVIILVVMFSKGRIMDLGELARRTFRIS